MNEHESCYGECKRIYPPKVEKFIHVDHALRVERAELVEHTKWLERCPRNRQKHVSHGEWFDVQEEHAIAVLKKWNQWMDSSPYEEKPSNGAPKRDPTEKSAKEQKVKERTSNKKIPKVALTTVWKLTSLKRDIFIDLCWPLELWYESDDGEVGTSLPLLTAN